MGKIVILNTAAFPSDQLAARIALCRVPILGAFLVRGLNAFARGATFMAVHRRGLTGDERQGYLFPYDTWAHRVAVHRFIRDIPMEKTHPSRATLEKIAAALPGLRPQRGADPLGWPGFFSFHDHFLPAVAGPVPPRRNASATPTPGTTSWRTPGAEARGRIARFLLQSATNGPT